MGSQAPWREAPGGPPPAPALTAELFPRLLGWEQGTKEEGVGCLRAWHSPCLQTPMQGCRVPPPSSPLSAAQSTNLPSWMLLFCWRFVSHITDVTSLRHRSSEMDLMSLCFLQLRKTSKKLSLKHPEEPAGLSATATVLTGGQI